MAVGSNSEPIVGQKPGSVMFHFRHGFPFRVDVFIMKYQILKDRIARIKGCVPTISVQTR
jgi:hypothetical protein